MRTAMSHLNFCRMGASPLGEGGGGHEAGGILGPASGLLSSVLLADCGWDSLPLDTSGPHWQCFLGFGSSGGLSVPILLSYLFKYGVNICWMAFLGTFRASMHFGAYKWSAWCGVKVLHEGKSV